MKTKHYNLLKHVKWQNIFETQTILITATKSKEMIKTFHIADDIDVSAVKVKIKNLRSYFPNKRHLKIVQNNPKTKTRKS